MPLLSVVMPNYNHAKFLPSALSAIVEQTLLKNAVIEVIVVDDASTDNSVEVIKEFQNKFSFIKILQQERNQGPVAAMNRALRASAGKYIALCSADDEIMPGFFQEAVELLEKYPKAGLCTTNFCYFNEGERASLFKNEIKQIQSSLFLEPKSLVQHIQKYNFWIPGNATILKRSSMIEAGLFNEEIKSLCDWFLCLVIAFREGACYIPKSLTAFRMSANGYNAKSTQAKLYDPFFRLLESPAYSDIKEAFLSSGILFQLDKEIFSYLFKKRGYRKYLLRIFLQKVRQKVTKPKKNAC